MSTREPEHAGPIAGGHLRVSDADRDEAVALLDAAAADGRIPQAEHAARLSRARSAVIFDDLFPLTYDLQGERPSLLPAPTSPAATPSTALVRVERPATPSSTEHLTAVFGGFHRDGTLRLRERTQAWIAFGGGDLDLTHAVFENNVCHVQVQCMFGGLDIIVPPGVKVEDRTMGVFGGTEVRGLDYHDTPDEPTIILTGVCMFGGISVKGPRHKSLAQKLGY